MESKLRKQADWGRWITKLFDAVVEPQLIQPTFITNYPAEVSPWSRRSRPELDLTECFELFIAGREIANGFSQWVIRSIREKVIHKLRAVKRVMKWSING